MTMTVEELAGALGAAVRGDGSATLIGCATLDDAGPQHLSFLANPKYLPRVNNSRAGAIVLSKQDAGAVSADRTIIVADDPYFAFRQAMVRLHGWRQQPVPGISPDAWIDETAEIGELCTIRPFAYIAPGAKVGKRCVIYPNCYVGKEARIGDDCTLYPGVTIYDGCILGDRVTLHAGCVIGQDGFGYATAPATDKSEGASTGEVMHHKIPQTGNAVIESDVEMGAHCSIDRATLGSTVIGRGTKFSNGVSIGHGTRIGPHNLFVAQVGVAGSSQTGAYVVLGGQAGVAGHLKVGDGVQAAGRSGIVADVPPQTQLGGMPARPIKQTNRMYVHQQRLPQMASTLKQLQRRIDELEARLNVSDSKS